MGILRAQYASKCWVCKKDIDVGALIQPLHARWVHPGCVAAGKKVITASRKGSGGRGGLRVGH